MSHPKQDTSTLQPIRFYSDDELDELEQRDPVMAYKIAHAQAMAERAPSRKTGPGEDAGPPNPAQVREAVEVVRRILNRDGGDIELVDIQDRVVHVRMKGACVGCPNSVLDLQNVVTRIVGAVPGVDEVRNLF